MARDVTATLDAELKRIEGEIKILEKQAAALKLAKKSLAGGGRRGAPKKKSKRVKRGRKPGRPAKRGRPPKKVAKAKVAKKRAGRKPLNAAERAAVSKRMKAYWAARRKEKASA